MKREESPLDILQKNIENFAERELGASAAREVSAVFLRDEPPLGSFDYLTPGEQHTVEATLKQAIISQRGNPDRSPYSLTDSLRNDYIPQVRAYIDECLNKRR